LRIKTVGLIALLLFTVAILFHFSAKKQPTAEETSGFDFLRQPLAWQGRPAPEVSLGLLNGEKFVLSEQVGKKVIILNFFTTWCEPCKAEMPELVRYADKHRDEPLLMIGIDDGEREEAVRDFVKNYGVSYPVAIDKDNEVQKQFNVRSFPTTVLIGADGTVHLYEVGPIQNADIAFDALVTSSLDAIRKGTGVTKEAFLQQLAAAPQIATAPTVTGEKKRDPEDDLPPGRPLDIAKKMNCPCGCSHTLMECTCKTSKEIKTRLRTMDLAGKADEDVMKTINKEFCMK